MVEHRQYLGVSDMFDSHPSSPVPRALHGDKRFSKEREFPVTIPSTRTPRGLFPAPSTDWGSLPEVLPTLLQGSTFMDARCLC